MTLSEEVGVDYLFVSALWQPRSNGWYEKTRTYWFAVAPESWVGEPFPGPYSYEADGSGYGPYPSPGEIPA